MNRPDDLDVWTIAGLLHVRIKAARDWIRAHVPAEAIRRQGRCLYIATWGLNYALAALVWRPQSPKGYQGCPRRLPVNVNQRDDLGRFVSNRVGPRPPKRKTPILPPTRRRYLSDAD